MSDETLLPCPFCGHADPLLQEHEAHKHLLVPMPDHHGSWTLECVACNVGMIEDEPGARARIIERWNRRAAPAPFQQRVRPWMLACFGEQISSDTIERNHRFLEEALELVQACGCTQSEAHQLVDYVFSRPVGERHQEVGGVMVTLAALCLAQQLDMHQAGEDELSRIWTKVEQIRAKQAAKPKNSPLPVAEPAEPTQEQVRAEFEHKFGLTIRQTLRRLDGDYSDKAVQAFGNDYAAGRASKEKEPAK